MSARAWLHQCGHLNKGDFNPAEAWCSGCRYEVRDMREVEARYDLVPLGRHEAVSA